MPEGTPAAAPTRRILVDCDGVLADFTGAVCRHFQRPLSSVTNWDYAKAWGYNSAIFWRDDMHFVRAPGFCASLGVLVDVRAAIDELRKLGEVLIVTSPMHNAPSWCGERIEWLRKFGVAENEIIFTSRKELIRGDVLIDDGPSNLEACREFMTTIAIHAPYNRSVTSDYRCDDVHDAAKVIRNL